jgi:HEAT repeat protein
MKKECILSLAFCLAPSIVATQPFVERSLEAKVENEMRIVYFDTEPPYVPLEKRLLALADRKAVSRVLVEFVQKFKDARTGDKYQYLVNSVQMVGKFQAADAIPALLEIAKKPAETSELRIFATRAIGEIDPKGNRSFLLEALRDNFYPIRHAAAEGLSRTGDQSVLYELEVVASRERSREASREIQALADALRTRVNGERK